MTADGDDWKRTSELYDQLVNDLFGASLVLAGVLGLDADEPVIERVRRAIAELDTAIGRLRHAALDRAIVAPNAAEFLDQPAAIPQGARRLHRLGAGELFAYRTGAQDYFRARDHALWAHETQGLLISARNGTPLARRDGRVFFDVHTDDPLYFEDSAWRTPVDPI